MRKKLCAVISSVLAVALLASGCAKLFPIAPVKGTETKTESKSDPEDEVSEATPEAHPVSTAADSVFTLRYNPESSFNPFSGANADNMALTGLMYEGLFFVDDDLNAEPLLCTDCTTDNGKNYIITLQSGVVFSDGTPFAAKDVVYSVTRARNTGRFANRLSNVVSTVAVGDDKVSITLSRVDYEFPALLDVPIVKDGTGHENVPVGTGPYRLVEQEMSDPYLVPVSGYRYGDKLPLDYIYLSPFSENDIIDTYSTRTLDLLRSGANGADDYNIHVESDTRVYNTMALTYIGFNTRHTVTTDPTIRRAISYAIDRELIYANAIGDAGRPSPLILPSYAKWYDSAWEENVVYSLQKTSEMFAQVGMDDYSQNGYLDYPIGDSNWREFALIVVANQEDDKKVEIAEIVVDTLLKTGINAEILILPWNEYLAVLERGDFDIYVAEAQVQSNFDLSAFFTEKGSLNYGKIANSKYKTLIDAFMAAADDETKKTAAKEMCEFIAEDAAVIPIAYGRASVVTHRNAIRGMEPSHSNIFAKIWEWTVRP